MSTGPNSSQEVHLFLVRHGETEWNTQRRFQGQKNSDLTERGKEQAQKCGQAISKKLLEIHELDAVDGHHVSVFASDLSRAFDTANIIRTQVLSTEGEKSPNQKVDEVKQHEGFREGGMGALEGFTWEEVRERDQKLHDAMRVILKQERNSDQFKGKVDFELPETREDILERAKRAVHDSIEHVLKEADENHRKIVVVVSHGGTLRTLFHSLLNGRDSHHELGYSGHIPNSSVSHFKVRRKEAGDHDFFPVKLTCTAHLDETGFIKPTSREKAEQKEKEASAKENLPVY